MIVSSKASAFSINEVGVIVKTPNQSIKNQPCIWLIHGSGGISSNEDIWIDRAFNEGHTVIIVDSYTNRGIFKQNWETLDEYRIPPHQRALDQVNVYNHLIDKKNLIPYADITNSIAVGFSDGGTAAIWLQSKGFPKLWKKSYSLYPGLKPTAFTSDMYDIHEKDVHVFVGELDNWTPACYCEAYQEATNCNLTIWPDTHHSFSKPGIDNWHAKTLNHLRERGVYCKYSEIATKKTMEIVFNG